MYNIFCMFIWGHTYLQMCKGETLHICGQVRGLRKLSAQESPASSFPNHVSPTCSRMWAPEELAPHFCRSFPKPRKVLSRWRAWTPPLGTSISANCLHSTLWENTCFLLFSHNGLTQVFFFFLMNNSNVMQFPPFSAEPFSLSFWVFCMRGLWKRRTVHSIPSFSALSPWDFGQTA